MQNHNLFPDNSNRLKLHDIEHVEKLARHIFANDAIGMKKVEKTFTHYKFVEPEIKQPKIRDYTMHHIPA
jgi:hypothetical protein